jgi:hypothetical protein
VTHYPLIIAPQRVPEIYFGAAAHSSTNTSTFSFTSLDFNIDNPERLVVVAVNYYEFDTSVTLSTVTVGGVTPTLVTSGSRLVVGGSGSFVYSALYQAQPTGTSGTVALTFSRAIDYGCSVGVWSAYYLNSTTAASSASGNDSVNLTVQPGDAVIATATSVYDATNTTWTNATENYDSAPNRMSRSGASALSSTSGTLNVAASCNTSAGGVIISGAAWR